MAYQSEIEKLENRYQDNPDQYFAPLAEQYRRAGEFERAVELVRAGLEKRPTYVSGHIVLGRCLVDMNQDEEAGRVFEQVLEFDAENIIALSHLGKIAERQGDMGSARRWLERLVEVDPLNQDAGEALDRLGSAVDGEAAPEPEPPTIETAAIEPEYQPDDESRAEPEQEVAVPEEPEPPPLPPVPSAFSGTRKIEPVVLEEAVAEDRRESLSVPGELEPEAEPEPAEAAPAGAAGDLGLTDFDAELGWGTGDRLSSQISEDVLKEAEELHDENIADTSKFISSAEPEEQVEVVEPDLVEIEPESAEIMPEPAEPEEPASFEIERTSEELPAFEADEMSVFERAADDLSELAAASESDFERAADDLAELMATGDDDIERASEEFATLDVPEPRDGESEDAPIDLDIGAEVVTGDAALSEVTDFGPEPDQEEEPLPFIAAGEEEIPAPVPAPAPAPAPVVTETMAEVYAKQGLIMEARRVYEELLERRPGDAVLEGRIRELDERMASFEHGEVVRDSGIALDERAAEPGETLPDETRHIYSARATGGMSIRSYLAHILSTSPPPGGWSGGGGPGTIPASGPETSPMREAFGGEEEGVPGGEPTMPAQDDLSLTSVFGDDPGTPSYDTTPSISGGPPAPKGGVSYDEFFGAAPPDAAPDGESDDGGGGGGGGGGGDSDGDDFMAWLKSLKS